jgi:MFS family permease
MLQGPERGDGPVSAVAGLRSRWALVALATTLYWLAVHSLRPLVPLRLNDLGASELYIGLIVSMNSMTALFLAIPSGRLMDRLGIMRVLLISLVIMVLTGFGYGLATTPDQFLVLMLVGGLGELGVWLALQALATHAGTGAFLSRQLWLFSLGWGIGVAVGPTVGGIVLEQLGFPALGFLFAALSLAATAVVFVPYPRRPDPTSSVGARQSSEKSALRTIARRPAVKGVLLSSYVILFINAIRLSFYPLYLEREGISLSGIGVLLSSFGATSLLIRFLLQRVVRRWGAGRVLVWSMWLCLVPMAATPLLAGNFWLLLVAAAFTGAAYGLNPPVTVELMARHTKPSERGVAMGMRITSNRLAQVTQPLLFGGVAASAGVVAAFPIAGVLLAGLTVWTWREADRISSASEFG